LRYCVTLSNQYYYWKFKYLNILVIGWFYFISFSPKLLSFSKFIHFGKVWLSVVRTSERIFKISIDFFNRKICLV
jgi:hypothetical protein